MSAAATPDRHLPWPLPALLGWILAWGLWAGSQRLGLVPLGAFALASGAGLALALPVQGRWRRALVAVGFPLSALASGAAVPAWSWLLLLAPLLLAYPLRAWADAPFFPTPRRALDGLEQAIALAPGARVLDAGCGAGHGLAALRRAWPQARLQGLEWSRPLAALTAWRCPWAEVARGDMWRASWAGIDLVYLFQRPESMARAFAKAEREMAPGSWFVSLEFAVPGRLPLARLDGAARRGVWIYRIGAAGSTRPAPSDAKPDLALHATGRTQLNAAPADNPLALSRGSQRRRVSTASA
jgi:SAM-dependent methyltransferase